MNKGRFEAFTLPLFDDFDESARNVALGQGAWILRGFVKADAASLLAAITAIVEASPLRQMITPGGQCMSVAMTNCGEAGWVSDLHGYRYQRLDPETGRPWPAMPPAMATLAARAADAAGFSGFVPDVCLVNRYVPGSRLSLHQDKNERDFREPIVSVSLGLPATFLWGGLVRSDRPRRVALAHGDVVVWGGPARMTFHGVGVLGDGIHSEVGSVRYNLTFRRAL
jgi:DNA oxidative demethylase